MQQRHSFFETKKTVDFYINSLFLFAEIVFLVSLGVFAKRNKNYYLLFLFCVFSLVFIVQMYSLHKTGGYLSPLALMNAQTAYSTNMKYDLLMVLSGGFILIQFVESYFFPVAKENAS